MTEKKLNALARLFYLIAQYKLSLVLNSLIKGQILTDYGYDNRFSGLFEINNEVICDVKNNQKLMILIYKYANGLSNSITNELF